MIIAREPLGYKQCCTRCSGEISKLSNKSLQNAWDMCHATPICTGVIEEKCGENSFGLCYGQPIQEAGLPGCFYTLRTLYGKY